jgi:hypothetical protein
VVEGGGTAFVETSETVSTDPVTCESTGSALVSAVDIGDGVTAVSIAEGDAECGSSASAHDGTGIGSAAGSAHVDTLAESSTSCAKKDPPRSPLI